MSSPSFPPPFSLNQPLTNPDPSPSSHYSFNSKVILAAMLILLIVVLFVLSLHVYAKWFWQPRNATLPLYPNGSRWRRSRSLADSTAVDETLVPTIGIGLDSATINSLPTFIYQASVHSDATEPLLECAVCLSEFQPYEKGRLLPNCKHSFHIGCIDMWFSSHSTCPLCRAPVSPWMPQQHVHNMSSQSGSTESPGVIPELPSTRRRTNEQTMMHSPLQDAPSIPLDCLHAQSISLSPTVPLLQGNSGIQLQEQHQEGLAKDGKQTWKLPTSAKLQASLQSCNVDGMSGSSSTMTNSMSTESRGQLEESGASIARCQSLGVPRSQSEDIEAGSLELQVKSRSFRMSIKRLLSRELSRGSLGRVFPSAAGDVPAEQDQEEQSSVGSRSPPV